MKAHLIAIATVAAITATPAFAGAWQSVGNWLERAGSAQRHFFTVHDPASKSPHCRYVLAHPTKFGDGEVKYCKNG